MTVAKQRLSTAEFDAQILEGLKNHARQVEAEYFEIPEYHRESLKRYRDATYGGIEDGWFQCRLTLALPQLTRAQRQRAADSLRRLSASGQIELDYSATGRVQYFRLVKTTMKKAR